MTSKSNNATEQSRYIEDGTLFEKKKYGDDVLLWADFKKGCVNTNCADDWYDYSIPFDDFIKFAEFIKKEREKYEK